MNKDVFAIKINGLALGVADEKTSTFKTFIFDEDQVTQFAEDLNYLMPQAMIEITRVKIDDSNKNDFHLPSEGKTLENAKGFFKEF